MNIKNKISKLFQALIYGKSAMSNEKYLEYMKRNHIVCGKDIIVVDPKTFEIDMTRPWLLEFGDSITFSDHVKILTHDYSWSVVAKKWTGEIYPALGKVKIGNNVFVGAHATILAGVTIGDNCIIGAGSIVTKDVKDDSVVAGIPARPIMTLEEYKTKLKSKSDRNLRTLVEEYTSKVGIPNDEDMYEFMTYYLTKNQIKDISPIFYERYKLDTIDYIPRYGSLEELIKNNC